MEVLKICVHDSVQVSEPRLVLSFVPPTQEWSYWRVPAHYGMKVFPPTFTWKGAQARAPGDLFFSYFGQTA